MRVLVTGSVREANQALLVAALDAYLAEYPEMCLITGMAEGVDEVARDWAARNHIVTLAEPLAAGEYPGPMHRYNEQMLGWAPDVVVACKVDLDLAHNPDAGTEHMCRIAAAAGVPVRWLQAGNQSA